MSADARLARLAGWFVAVDAALLGGAILLTSSVGAGHEALRDVMAWCGIG